MTSPAGFAFPHLFHADFLLVPAGCVDCGMAFAAFVNPDMGGVAEGDIAGTFDNETKFLDRVAGIARANREGCFAVMAGTARFSFFHLGHADLGVTTGLEQFIVAIPAGKFCGMCRVPEFDWTGFFYSHSHIFNFVAGGAFG